MMQALNLTDVAKIVYASPGLVAGATTGGDCDYVSLKNYDRCTVVIAVDNATTVTGGAVTLKQATAVAGTSEKALAFSRYLANVDIGASDTLVETTATSDTFTTDTTDNKNQLFVIEVKAEDLDQANGFDCLRADVASMANAIEGVFYVLHGARYASPIASSAITD
jgi:hypothetical protein